MSNSTGVSVHRGPYRGKESILINTPVQTPVHSIFLSEWETRALPKCHYFHFEFSVSVKSVHVTSLEASKACTA